MNTWASPRPPCPQYPTISTPTQLTPNPKRTELVPALVIQLLFPRLRGGSKDLVENKTWTGGRIWTTVLLAHAGQLYLHLPMS